MSFTDTTWEQGTPQNDLTLFLGADQWTDFTGLATNPAAPAAGLLYKVVPATVASKFFITAEGLLQRAGVYASAALSQQQYGTAASVPGPSQIAGTSGPLGLGAGFPPIVGAKLATLTGGVSGPIPKGVQINSVDVIYQVLTLAASAATLGLTTTKFANLTAPVVANIIALGTNGLPTAIGAQPQVTNVPVVAPAMITSLTDTQVLLNVNLTAGATGTVNFYGAVLKCSFNFN